MSLLPLRAQEISAADRANPPEAVAPADQAARVQALVESFFALESLEATYDLTGKAGSRYETRQIVADFVSGRYLIRSVHFRDPERKMGSGCTIETWDGKEHVRFTSGLSNASLQGLAEGKYPLIGSAVVNADGGTFDPVLLSWSRREFFGTSSLPNEIKSAIDARDFQFIDARNLKVGYYQIELLPDGSPREIKSYSDTENGPEVFRSIVFGDYREIGGKRVATDVEVRFRSVDGASGKWGDVWQARLHPSTIKLNGKLADGAFHFTLPAGVNVRDDIKGISYVVPDDPEEYSGKDLKNHAPRGLAEMAIDKKIWAKSFLGKKGPEVVVEKWVTSEPDLEGKFVLVDLWATWCGPCRKSIPGLNEIQEKFGDKLAVVGISNESEETVRAMKVPAIKYAHGIDSEGRVAKALEVKGFPHVILMDPRGIVRWEGFPLLDGQELTNQVVAEILDTYGK